MGARTVERRTRKPEADWGADRSLRRRLTLRGEFALAVVPTLTVLSVFALVEALSRQRLLFPSFYYLFRVFKGRTAFEPVAGAPGGKPPDAPKP